MTTFIKILRCSFKASLLVWLMAFAHSCANNPTGGPDSGESVQNASTGEQSPEILTIDGTVSSITFGKDGYSAIVQTETKTAYTALVSIVNLGGMEKYQACEVGDKVSFKGKAGGSGEVRELIVSEIPPIDAAAKPDLEANYKNIPPNTTCWQSNKVLDLYKQPSRSSKVEGKHFDGELLQVLGTKMVENQLWVNVTYRLKVKQGYESQFADGQVMSTGLPTGWIGGAETPKINCE